MLIFNIKKKLLNNILKNIFKKKKIIINFLKKFLNNNIYQT